jgi:hypothetical protein
MAGPLDKIQAENDLIELGGGHLVDLINKQDFLQRETLLIEAVSFFNKPNAVSPSEVSDLDDLEMEKILGSTAEEIAVDLAVKKAQVLIKKRAGSGAPITSSGLELSETVLSVGDVTTIMNGIWQRMETAEIPFVKSWAPGTIPSVFVWGALLFSRCGIAVSELADFLPAETDPGWGWGALLTKGMTVNCLDEIERRVHAHYGGKIEQGLPAVTNHSTDGLADLGAQDSVSAADPNWGSW